MDDPNPQARADALSYKLRKEAFVSNLSGSSLTDINLVTLVVTVCVICFALQKHQTDTFFFLSQQYCSGMSLSREDFYRARVGQ